MRLGSIVVVAALLGWALPAHAQSADEVVAAEVAFRAGRDLMEQKKYAEACVKFEAAEQLDRTVGTLANLGECNEQLGRTATAWIWFKQAADLADQKTHPKAKEIRSRADALKPKLRKLIITVTADAELAGYEVQRDGVVVSAALYGTEIPIDPGDHEVNATATGRVAWSRTVSAPAEGETTTVEIPALAVDEAAVAAVVEAESAGLFVAVKCGRGRVLGASKLNVSLDGEPLTAVEAAPGEQRRSVEFRIPRGEHQLRVAAAGCVAHARSIVTTDDAEMSGSLRRTFRKRFRDWDGPGASRSSYIALQVGAQMATQKATITSPVGDGTVTDDTKLGYALSLVYTRRWLEVAAEGMLSRISLEGTLNSSGEENPLHLFRAAVRVGARLPLVFGSVSAGVGYGDTTWSVDGMSGEILKFHTSDVVFWAQAEFRPHCYFGLGLRGGATGQKSADLEGGNVDGVSSTFVGLYLTSGREVGGKCNPKPRITWDR